MTTGGAGRQAGLHVPVRLVMIPVHHGSRASGYTGPIDPSRIREASITEAATGWQLGSILDAASGQRFPRQIRSLYSDPHQIQSIIQRLSVKASIIASGSTFHQNQSSASDTKTRGRYGARLGMLGRIREAACHKIRCVSCAVSAKPGRACLLRDDSRVFIP